MFTEALQLLIDDDDVGCGPDFPTTTAKAPSPGDAVGMYNKCREFLEILYFDSIEDVWPMDARRQNGHNCRVYQEIIFCWENLEKFLLI